MFLHVQLLMLSLWELCYLKIVLYLQIGTNKGARLSLHLSFAYPTLEKRN